MRSSGITKLAVLAVAVLTIPAGAAQAAQVTAPQVPVSHLTGFHQIVVDNAAGYIFLSAGADALRTAGRLRAVRRRPAKRQAVGQLQRRSTGGNRGLRPERVGTHVHR